MTLPRHRPRIGNYGAEGPFDISPYVTYIKYYRYRKKGTTTWTSWQEYDPGTETIYIQNLTGSTVTYEFQQKVEAIFQGSVYEEWIYDSLVHVPPTPQFSCDNWTIDPATPQFSGDWDYTFDVVSTPSYWGSEGDIDVEVTIRCYDFDGNLLDTFVHTPSVVSGQCTGTITLGTWTTDTANEYGYFEFDVDISVPGSPVIPDATCSHTFLDTWEGTVVTAWCCNNVDTIGMYDWSSDAYLNNYCTETVVAGTTVYYKVVYNSDSYADYESTWEIRDGSTVYASGGFPASTTGGIHTGSFTYSGDIDLLYLYLQDSYGDGGVEIVDWGFSDEAAVECVGGGGPTPGDGCSCSGPKIVDLSTSDYVYIFWDDIDCDTDTSYGYAAVTSVPSGEDIYFYDSEGAGHDYMFDVYDDECNYLGTSSPGPYGFDIWGPTPYAGTYICYVYDNAGIPDPAHEVEVGYYNF
ncbi:MAG: hypothetical protein GF334_12385 [Candidatus Altiarchaeales archaeon]|nr:hypothetical protein [Candidatus Altiarchaeales archaeon]